MTTGAKSVFVDTNILIYAQLELAPQHSHAQANIAATMLAHGVRTLLTHNVSDFRRFEPHIETLPLFV